MEIADALPTKDLPTCRICYGGVEDEPECGRLISPCKCSGTMKYVHVGCLNQWRLTSANTSSYFTCNQCRYEYALRRTWMATWVNNRITLFVLTVFALTVIGSASGIVTNGILYIACVIFNCAWTKDKCACKITHAVYDDTVTLPILFLDSLLVGLAVVGLLGFIWWLLGGGAIGDPDGNVNLNMNGINGVGDLVALIVVSIILIGLYAAFKAIYTKVKLWCMVRLEALETEILNT